MHRRRMGHGPFALPYSRERDIACILAMGLEFSVTATVCLGLPWTILSSRRTHTDVRARKQPAGRFTSTQEVVPLP
jgi:hypothetical protein